MFNLVRELGYKIADAKRRFVTQHFTRQRQVRARPNCHQHRAITTLTRQLTQAVVNLDDSLRNIGSECLYNLIVEFVRVRIVASRRAGFEPMTQVATRNESNAATHLLNSLPDT